MGGSEASGEPIRPSARAPIERLRGGGGNGGLRLGGGRGLGQGHHRGMDQGLLLLPLLQQG